VRTSAPPRPQPGDPIWVVPEGEEAGRAAILVQWQPDDRAIIQYIDGRERLGTHAAVPAATVHHRKGGAQPRARGPTPNEGDPFQQLLDAIPRVSAALRGEITSAEQSLEGKRRAVKEEKERVRKVRSKRRRQIFLIEKTLHILKTGDKPLRTPGRIWTAEQREGARERMIATNRKRGRSKL
jgi:hypothetical protein